MVCVCLVFMCDVKYGICGMCYGCDLVWGILVNMGEVVGVIVV